LSYTFPKLVHFWDTV